MTAIDELVPTTVSEALQLYLDNNVKVYGKIECIETLFDLIESEIQKDECFTVILQAIAVCGYDECVVIFNVDDKECCLEGIEFTNIDNELCQSVYNAVKRQSIYYRPLKNKYAGCVLDVTINYFDSV
jgi:hypothetical protein